MWRQQTQEKVILLQEVSPSQTRPKEQRGQTTGGLREVLGVIVTAKLRSCAKVQSAKASNTTTSCVPVPKQLEATQPRGAAKSVQWEATSYTEAQEEFLKKLPPELAQQCRDSFCNTASRTAQTSSQNGFLAEYGLIEWPVIMMLPEVTANACQKIGTLIDLASDINYITHEVADRLNLRSEDIMLVVHGVGGMKVFIKQSATS